MAQCHTTFLFTVLAILVIQACCSPSKHNLRHCDNPDERYERVETYTVGWFRENVRKDVMGRYKNANKEAPFNNTLFYTRGMSESAKEYACQEKLITIWEPWNPALYNSDPSKSNNYSCIHHNETSRNIFFENMSEAFATLATRFVHVMHAPTDYKKPPTDGIWGRIEQKALRNRVFVVRISKLSGTDKKTIQAIWDRMTGWMEDSLDVLAHPFDQPELKRKLRKRSRAYRMPVEDDTDTARKRCNRLPVNTLPVNW